MWYISFVSSWCLLLLHNALYYGTPFRGALFPHAKCTRRSRSKIGPNGPCRFITNGISHPFFASHLHLCTQRLQIKPPQGCRREIAHFFPVLFLFIYSKPHLFENSIRFTTSAIILHCPVTATVSTNVSTQSAKAAKEIFTNQSSNFVQRSRLTTIKTQ